MKTYFFLPLSLLLLGCQPDKPAQTAASETKPTDSVAAPAVTARTICYELKEGRSVAVAKLTFSGDSVSGTLDYLFAEKDQTRGTVKGVMKGDVLEADYTFRSEGSTSVSEVIFKVEGDLLIQGHGPMGEYKGKVIYLFPDKVEFSTAFKAKAC